MALTHTGHVKPMAERIAQLSELMSDTLTLIHEVLEHNSDLSIDWAGDPKPAYINEDAAGNIDGTTFSRAAVANAIGSLDQVRRLLTNSSVSQGDHLGNLNKLAEIE